VEGDSQFIVAMLAKLLNDFDPSNIYPSWCLLCNIEFLKSILLPILVIIPSHVFREANKIVDHLANVGVECREQDLVYDDNQRPKHPLLLK
jgi:hypothetical protein